MCFRISSSKSCITRRAAGEFAPKDKLRAAFRSNLRFYAYATVIVVVLAVIVAVSKGFWPSQVRVVAVEVGL